MNEEKAKKLIVASTVGAVLLAIVLFAVLFYQIIAISVENKKIKYFNAKIAEYNQMIEDGIDIKNARMQKDWIVYQAKKLGYMFVNGSILKK